MPNRLKLATDDTSQYLDNTGREINALLVTNYAELEEVLGEILDDSGPILKRTLAQVTEAVAIDNLVMKYNMQTYRAFDRFGQAKFPDVF